MRWFFASLLIALGIHPGDAAKPASLALGVKLASKGEFPEPAMVEVEGFYKDRFQAVRLFSSGVGIANGQRQFGVTPETLKSVFKALDRYGFADMPEQFGGKPRLTNKPELRSAVTLRLGSWEKTVVQMRDGEQSKAFAKLVKRIFAAVEGTMSQGVSVASFHEGLKAVVEGALAPETVALTLAWEEQPKAFAVYAISGLHVTWTPAGGGEVRRYWLGQEAMRELAKLLLTLEPEGRPVRFYSSKQVSLEAWVLNHRWGVEGRAWAGSVGERERAFAGTWESVEQELKRVLKEARVDR